MIDRNLLLRASDASVGVTAALAAVEDAKRAVEEARAAVDVARQGVTDAKASYEAAIADIASTGVPAAKAKRAVEELSRIFSEFADEGAVSRQTVEARAPRKRKTETAPATSEGADASAQHAASGDIQTAAEHAAGPVADATVETVAVAETNVVPAHPEVEAEVEADESTAVEVVEEAGINNAEAVAEIFGLIESETANEDIFVSETLITVLNAADVYSVTNGAPLDVDAFRTTLNEEFVETALSMTAEMHDLLGELRSILATPQKVRVLSWFDEALLSLQDGKVHRSFAEFSAPAASVISEEDEIPASDEDYIADPEQERADDGDDETLSLSGVEAEEVENIEEINFLEPAAPAAAAAEPARAAAPAPGRRPSFLPRK